MQWPPVISLSHPPKPSTNIVDMRRKALSRPVRQQTRESISGGANHGQLIFLRAFRSCDEENGCCDMSTAESADVSSQY